MSSIALQETVMQVLVTATDQIVESAGQAVAVVNIDALQTVVANQSVIQAASVIEKSIVVKSVQMVQVVEVIASGGAGSWGNGGNTPATIAYAATLAPASAGDVTYRVILTGNLVLNLPTGGADGDRVRIWLNASGADRVFTLNASYKIPASSVFTSPVTITSGKKAKLLLEYDATLNGGQWEVTSFINGY